MKKFLIILSYVSVAVVSGFISVIGYNTLLQNKIINDYEQLELREQQLKLNYRQAQLELDIQEKASYLKHQQKIEDLRQKEREIELANRKTSNAFTR